jgi:hypothetical protein
MRYAYGILIFSITDVIILLLVGLKKRCDVGNLIYWLATVESFEIILLGFLQKQE